MNSSKTELIAKEGEYDFFIIREFDASTELVFAAFTEPVLLVQWFMPQHLNLQVNKMDCQTGGSYHLTYQGPGNITFGFRGVYHEVIDNNYIIKTSEFEGLPQKLDPVLEKIVFDDTGTSKCKVTIHAICPSVSYRDNMMAAGMEPTLEITHSQLDKLLLTINKKK